MITKFQSSFLVVAVNRNGCHWIILLLEGVTKESLGASVEMHVVECINCIQVNLQTRSLFERFVVVNILLVTPPANNARQALQAIQ